MLRQYLHSFPQALTGTWAVSRPRKRLLRGIERKEFICAVDARDRIMGVLEIRRRRNLYTIRHLVVEREFRGRGLARKMLAFLETIVEKDAKIKIELWCKATIRLPAAFMKRRDSHTTDWNRWVCYTNLNSQKRNVMPMEEKLLKILKELRPEVDFTETRLIDEDILDSFDDIALVGELNDTFDIQIGPEHLLPEKF